MDFLQGLTLNDRKLVVGIDFGTTYSGIAWAETRRADHHSIIETWPSRLGISEGMSSVKVPTELRYTPEGTEWGFQIPPLLERHQWFKLRLAEKMPLAGLNEEKTPEELTTDYLAELYKHLMYTLELKLGAAILRTISLEFCLTVPAIWSEFAKEKTLKACERAGLQSASETLLVSEPEAAAIYTLHSLDPHGLNIGDSFVVCDSGGGTVDLISYTITELHPVLRVKEAAAGTGSLCGSTFLNCRFADFLTTKLGGEAGWDDEILAEAMERFESVIKKQFVPTTASEDGYTILVPGLADNPKLGIRRGRFTITPEEMRDIFEPIIKEVIELIKGQIRSSNKNISTVLLVGGFGQNNYLKERLRSSLSEVEVLQPPNAWSAIMRGAVILGMSCANSNSTSIDVASRTARKHYGVLLDVNYDIGIHDSDKKYWCPKFGLYRVHALKWFLRKGDAVEENKPQQIHFEQDFLVNDGLPKSGTLSVYADSDSIHAPVHETSSVQKIVVLGADLTHLSKEDLFSKILTRKDGKRYYCIAGTIEATFYSASTKICVKDCSAIYTDEGGIFNTFIVCINH